MREALEGGTITPTDLVAAQLEFQSVRHPPPEPSSPTLKEVYLLDVGDSVGTEATGMLPKEFFAAALELVRRDSNPGCNLRPAGANKVPEPPRWGAGAECD